MRTSPCLITLGSALLFGWGALVAAGAAETLTRIADVRSLTREEAARGLPALVRGVVTWRGGPDELTVQDASAGIWINLGEARKRRLWVGDEATLALVHEGSEVEIDGSSDAGGYAPVIFPRTLRIVGKKPLPVTRPMDPVRFFGGAEAGQRIEARGVVQGVQPMTRSWALQINAPPSSFMVEISRAALLDPTVIVDAEVRVRGVGASAFNTRGELTNVRILVSLADDLVVEKPAATSPFDAPRVPLRQLQPFRPEPATPHRVLIDGTVTYSLPGQFLYLQDGASAVRVETQSALPLEAGDRVEAVGFIDMTSRHVGMLRGAVLRKVGVGRAPAPTLLQPEKIMALNTGAINTGQAASPHDFDGHLIRFSARLLAVQSAAEAKSSWRRLTLAHRNMILSAILYAGDSQPLDALAPDSELEVTGIVALEYAPKVSARQVFQPVGLNVVLRSATDVIVVRAPSWWTTQRLLVVLAIALLAFGSAMVWAWQLRAQVQRKSLQLAAEMHARRDAAIEFQAAQRERNRLAANLHDTLLQTMSGLNYQLEACEAESLPPDQRPANHLETARRMVQRGQEDLRGTVWALRVLPLTEHTFADALRTLGKKLGEGRPVTITVESEGTLPNLTDFVAGNLLLVAQEAMHNALKHASPSHLDVRVVAADGGTSIDLTIRDDGAGFNPVGQAGPNSGHFGLEGMRERIEKFGGTLQIESAPGHGTRVHAIIPLKAYDDELA